MTEKDATTESTEQQRETQPPSRSGQSMSLSMLLSILAVLLAAFALVSTLAGNKHMNAQRVNPATSSRLGALEGRVNHMEALMATDRRGMMQAQVKKLLYNVRELSRLGDAKTKVEISKVENILRRLTTAPATKVKARVDMKSTEQPVETNKTATPATSAAIEKPQPANTERPRETEATQPESVQPDTEKQAPPQTAATETPAAPAAPAGKTENKPAPDTEENAAAAPPAPEKK